MTELSTKHKSFIKALAEDQQYGFKLLLQREDFYTFFDALIEANIFNPENNPAPKEGTKKGYYFIPYWDAMDYLVAISKFSNEKQDMVTAQKVMQIIRQIALFQGKDGELHDNYHTNRKMAECLGYLPTQVVTKEDIDFLPQWLQGKFEHGIIGHELGKLVLPHFLDSKEPLDWEKATAILKYSLGLKDVGTWEPTSVVQDHWLKELINKNSAELGRKVGRLSADVFLLGLRSLFSDSERANSSWLYRPAVEHHAQNHSWKGPDNRFVEGLRDILISWTDSDPKTASPYILELINDPLEIVRRIGIFLANDKWEILGQGFLQEIKQDLFKLGHIHELYDLLKKHFMAFPDEKKQEVLTLIRNITVSGEEDAENRKQRIQLRWLSALQGQNYKPVDEWIEKLKTNKEIGISNHPDFNSYMETSWGSGPSTYQPQELVAFAINGNLIEKLNAFEEKDPWGGPTVRSLCEALENAIVLKPAVFVSLLSNCLSLKRPYQHGIIIGFKKVWDAEQDKHADLDWSITWERLITFFEGLVRDPTFWQENTPEDGTLTPNRNWIVSAIADSIQAGTRKDSHSCPASFNERLFSLIAMLLEKTEPDSEFDTSDAMTRSINTNKGRVIEAFFNFALRICRLEDAEKSNHAISWKKLQPLFDQELAKCQNDNFEFSTLASAYCAQFEYLSNEWLKENIKKIFPLQFPKNFACAAEGLSYTPARGALYEMLLNAGIIESILSKKLQGKHTRSKIIERVALAYLWGIEKLDSGVFSKVVAEGDADDLKTIGFFLWSVHEQAMPEKEKEKILAFVRKVFENKTLLEKEDKELFLRLGYMICYLDSISSEDLKWLFAVTPYMGDDFRFMSELARLAKICPNEVDLIFQKFVETCHPVYDYEDNILKVIKELGSHSELRNHAIAYTNKLRNMPGMMELYNALVKEETVRKV